MRHAHSPVRILATSVGLMGLSVIAGWWIGGMSHATWAVTPIAPAAGTVSGDFRYIAGRNLYLALSMVSGTVTIGITSLVQMVWNGVALGFGVAAIAARCRPVLLPMLTYIPLEFLAFALVAGASAGIGLSVVRFLCLDEPLRLRGYAMVLPWAASMIVMAAFIEAYMKHHVNRQFFCTTP
jgi:uncharacterized membrane protein SpoIIM required for sporulation